MSETTLLDWKAALRELQALRGKLVEFAIGAADATSPRPGTVTCFGRLEPDRRDRERFRLMAGPDLRRPVKIAELEVTPAQFVEAEWVGEWLTITLGAICVGVKVREG